MNEKILLIGEHFSENLGDGVICQTVQHLIQQEHPDATFFYSDLSGRKAFKQQRLNVAKKRHWLTFKAKKKAVSLIKKHPYLHHSFLHGDRKMLATIKEKSQQDYDFAVFAGGQLLMDYFSFSISRHLHFLNKRQTPTFFNACGMGSIRSKGFQKILQRALAKEVVSAISVRDDVAGVNQKLLQRARLKATSSYDPALWAKEAFQIQKKDSETIGLGVISTNKERDDQLIQLYQKVIRQLDAKKIRWTLFCNGSLEDQVLALQIAEHSGHDASVVAPRPESPKALVELISRYRSIISFRLHSHIIAASLGVPSVAITWDNKVDFFFEHLRCGDRVFKYDSKPQDMLHKLTEAETEGYDDCLIQQQKEESRLNLLKNIQYIQQTQKNAAVFKKTGMMLDDEL